MAKITSKITSIVPTDSGVNSDVSDSSKTIERVAKHHERPKTTKTPTRISNPTAPTFTDDQALSPQSFAWIRVFSVLSLMIWLSIAALICFYLLEVPKNIAIYSALEWGGLIGMVLSPVLLILLTAYSFRQLAKISTQAQVLATTANQLTKPDDTVIRKSKIMAVAISNQVDEVNEMLSASLGRLATLEDVLNTQTGSIAKSNIDARQTADYISAILQGQSEALDSISGTFDERMLALSQMITSHTDKLAHATQIAEQKIKEARISVEGATSKINAASDIVRSNTVQAASTLSASHQDINSLGDIIRERSLELDTVYKKHANDLTAMIEHLRDEQQNLGAILEERLTKMRDLSLSAQASAESLIKASAAGKDTVEALAQSASLADTAVTARFNEMKDMVRYSNEHAQSISDKAAERVKNSLELTRKEIGRIEDDMADLQNKMQSTSRKSLEFVPDNAPISDVNTQGELSPQKRRRTRLKFKPVPQEIEKTPETPIENIIPDIKTHDEALINPTHKQDEDDILDLYIEPNIEDNIVSKIPQTSIAEVTPIHKEQSKHIDTVHRTAPIEQDAEKKSGFSLRNLFGGRKADEDDASLSIVAQTPPKPIPLDSNIPNATPLYQQPSSPTDENILQALTQLGLAPNAVVDDGCIIEATNSRTSSGHEAMSRSVATRLAGPVKHLAKAMSLDSHLSQSSIKFASNFDQTIESVAADREAVRKYLESEFGRAYLLCDAALNYGRV